MRNYLIFIIIFISISIFGNFQSNAAVRRICNVSYEANYGWSEEYTLEVTFLTGAELNKATQSFKHNQFDQYACIWFDQGEVAVLKFDNIIIGVGSVFTAEDFYQAFQILSEKEATQINDSKGRKWKIKAKNYIHWIDPRVK